MPSTGLSAGRPGAGSGAAVAADRATLTARYLDEVARRGGTAADLLAVMPTTGMLPDWYRQRYLSRPLFIGHAEADQVNSDLLQVREAIASLPDLLYDGDWAAFARIAGLTEVQSDAVLRTRAGRLTEWLRADMYTDANGLRLMEFNMGSAVGGSDIGEVCRAMLRYQLLREFAREHRLHYPDTMAEQVRLIFAESGFEPGAHPMMAFVDWPVHFGPLAPYLRKVSRRWRGLGLDAHVCHLGQLRMHDGRVWLRGRPVDIIFRIFLIEHLLEPGGPELMFPVLDAVARGEVAMFTPMETDMYGSKAALAMLSDPANRHLFTPAQRAAFDRVLPWTRMMRPGPVALEDGSRVDLMEYALGHPGDLLVKPAFLHGGIGVVAGWDTTEQAWRDSLNQAMGGPYVLQRRIRAIPELFPGDDGEPVAWETTWGVFTSAAGFGGAWAKAFQTQPGRAVLQIGPHRRFAGCLVQHPEPPAQD
jgi:hypothetical protein